LNTAASGDIDVAFGDVVFYLPIEAGILFISLPRPPRVDTGALFAADDIRIWQGRQSDLVFDVGLST